MKEQPPPITPLEFEESDFKKAEAIAKKLGYQQTAYTSTSGLWGLFCLQENPATHPNGPKFKGCVIKTKEWGLCFIQTEEDFEV